MDILDIILNEVCIACNLNKESVISRKRDTPLKIARFFYFYYARQKTEYSWSEIAEKCKRDHSTAMHGAKRISDLIEINKYVDIMKLNSMLSISIDNLFAEINKSQIPSIEMAINELTEKLNKLKKLYGNE